MGQHPDPDPDKHEVEELGAAFYRGTGLSVRALTVEELRQFLDAHADEPAQLVGTGWDALDRPVHPFRVPRAPSGAELAPTEPQPVLPAQPVTGSLGHPGRSALTHYRRRRATELAAWTRSLTLRSLLVAAAGLVAGALAALVGWRLRFRPPARPGLAAGRRRRAPHRPAAGPPRPRRLRHLPRPGHARLARES